MILNASIIFAFAVFGFTTSVNIPDYIHVCKRTDPDVSKCIKESIELIRPRLTNGIQELGVPALDPLRIQDFDAGRGSRNFKVILKNIDVAGASDFQLNKLKVNIPNLTFRIQVALPLLRLTGLYDVNARILVVPFKGEGKFYANASNCAVNAVLKGELIDANGEEQLHFSKLDMKLLIGDYNIKLESTDNNDPILVQAASDVLNQNRKDFIEVVTPFLETRISEILLEIANDIVKHFSYENLFPEK
ncbi:hypothetical protein FQR65_LT13088 [Abscondita terminalis]|nr:hypothetical protein FQR65_LT13088 [Abscondita terminalis]